MECSRRCSTRLHAWYDELLYVWDGEGRYLGRVLDITYEGNTLGGIVFVNAGWVISVAMTAGAKPPLAASSEVYFYESDCQGTALIAGSAPDEWLGPVLIPDTGDVYARNSQPLRTNGSVNSFRYAHPGSACVNETSTRTGYEYDWSTAFSPYAPGLVLDAMLSE